MINFFKKKLKRTTFTRSLFFILSDILLLLFCVWLAFLLRFDGKIPNEYSNNFQASLILVPIFVIPFIYFQRIYLLNWTYVSIRDLIALFIGITLGFVLLGVFILLFREPQKFLTIQSLLGFPRSLIFIEYFLSLIFLGGLRISKRIYLQITAKRIPSSGKRLLIVGAGDAGEQISRSILNAGSHSSYLPIGFIDDASQKRGTLIHGLPILGNLEKIGQIIKKYSIEEMIIALPSADSNLIKKAVQSGREAGIKNIRILPSLSELISEEISLADLREVRIDDLLGRELIKLDLKEIEKFLRGKRILITGAAGSIGAELCRQIAKFKPALILAIDQDETALFWLTEEFREKFPKIQYQDIICDICDKKKFEKIFQRFRPNVVFHSAAYKHVPLMEENPDEGIKTNIKGTKITAELFLKHGGEKFVLISTDKAVNPTSVMGATKRVAEILVSFFNEANQAEFVAVRFGNVLDSRGSVISIFKEQIKRGGPVKITHPRMERFFMSPSEAILLVLEASAIGRGGNIYVLDMGEPIKILELAKNLIRLSGLEPDKDIPILFTQPRPGEKFSEELFSAEEKVMPTKHNKIFETKIKVRFSRNDFFKKIDNLIKLAEEAESKENLKKALQEIIE